MENSLEFHFTDQDFKKISDLVTSYSGIMLPEQKKMLVYSRLVKRLRALGLSSFADYAKKLENEFSTGRGDELINVVNAMTTNVTNFFREEYHFAALKEYLPELYEKFGPVKVWSCASSTGEEPWSIAMVIADAMRATSGLKAQLHASDLDTHVLERASSGEYNLAVSDVEKNTYLKRYLKKVGGPTKTVLGAEAFTYKVHENLRSLVKFSQINLVKPFPAGHKAHIVFCRNVIIYFNREVKTQLFKKMAAIMPEGGILMIGHSESLMGITEAFDPIGKTMYRRNHTVVKV